jgi:hypothetical protein
MNSHTTLLSLAQYWKEWFQGLLVSDFWPTYCSFLLRTLPSCPGAPSRLRAAPQILSWVRADCVLLESEQIKLKAGWGCPLHPWSWHNRYFCGVVHLHFRSSLHQPWHLGFLSPAYLVHHDSPSSGSPCDCLILPVIQPVCAGHSWWPGAKLFSSPS